MTLATVLMYLMMQKQAMTPSQPIKGDCLHEAGEYPAIKREVDETPACRFYLDDNHCRGVKRSTKKTYTCKSPDTEVLEFTVSGRAFCRKVAP